MNALQLAFLALALYSGDGDSVWDLGATVGFCFFLEMAAGLVAVLVRRETRVRPSRRPACALPPFPSPPRACVYVAARVPDLSWPSKADAASACPVSGLLHQNNRWAWNSWADWQLLCT